ncbi:MAG: hypothetical protein QF473_34460, partial [Planctomycetota bacterium]|nr:hypothetical protein [Planctomycetota bacterium]
MDAHTQLKISVTDISGKPLPCRIHLKQADGTAWLPPDVAEPVYSEKEAPDLLHSSHYDRYLHLCHDANLESLHLNHGAATLPIPNGQIQVFLSRGHEFMPVTD